MEKYTLLIDVDGVLNTGQFLYSSEGKIFKIFGPHDHDGLKLVKGKINIQFITADKKGYSISKKRVDDMGFDLELVSEQDRFEYVKQNYELNNLIYIGDGYHDAQILKNCKFGIAPKNARNEAKNAADYITESKAGEGAVLDACLEIKKRYID